VLLLAGPGYGGRPEARPGFRGAATATGRLYVSVVTTVTRALWWRPAQVERRGPRKEKVLFGLAVAAARTAWLRRARVDAGRATILPGPGCPPADLEVEHDRRAVLPGPADAAGAANGGRRAAAPGSRGGAVGAGSPTIITASRMRARLRATRGTGYRGTGEPNRHRARWAFTRIG
jgi:hypothetical protein